MSEFIRIARHLRDKQGTGVLTSPGKGITYLDSEKLENDYLKCVYHFTDSKPPQDETMFLMSATVSSPTQYIQTSVSENTNRLPITGVDKFQVVTWQRS